MQCLPRKLVFTIIPRALEGSIRKWSETSKAELRVPFEIKECNLYKTCSGSNPAPVFTVMGSVVT